LGMVTERFKRPPGHFSAISRFCIPIVLHRAVAI
jgi:hypothetical protein